MGKLLLIAITALSFAHPFYLSVTDLKYNAKEQALQGSVKIFVNDLEATLKKITNTTVDLIHIKDSASTIGLLKNYLNSHLSLQLNGKARTFDLIGFEREEEALWMYVEFKKCETPKLIQISNSILFEQLPGQTNIVHLEVNGAQKSSKATNPDRNFSFDFRK
jgi:hypothetical protein